MEYKLFCFVVMVTFWANAYSRVKVRDINRPYSILRKCLNSTIDADECTFLRNFPRLWNEFRDIRHQIRRLKLENNKPPIPVKELIPIEQMRLTILQLKIGVTRNNEHGVILDQHVSNLSAEDQRFRESLRFLKEIDIVSLQEEIQKLRRENFELQNHLETLIENETSILQAQIAHLQQENELLKHNQKIIQEENLVFVRNEIIKIQKENEAMKANFTLLLETQKENLNNRIDNTNTNLTLVSEILDNFKSDQTTENNETKFNNQALFNITETLNMKLQTFKNNSLEKHSTAKSQIWDIVQVIGQVNNSVNSLSIESTMQHEIIHGHISRIDDTIMTMNLTIRNHKIEKDLEHSLIHQITSNLSMEYEHFLQTFTEFTVYMDNRFNITKEEVHALWQGKEYVNETLLSIAEKHDQDNNQTYEIIKMLQANNKQQDINLRIYKASEYRENMALQEQITGLKHHDEHLNKITDNLETILHKQGNDTHREIMSLQYMDNLINESLKSVTRKLSGPYLIFTAFPSQKYVTYEGGDKLIFDKTVLNYGNFYNEIDGSFKCPVYGIYQSFVSVWSEFDNRGQIEVMKESSVLIKAAAQPDPGSRQHGSNLVNYICHRGEVVWLRGGTDGILYTDEHRQNSFSTTLLLNLEYYGSGKSNE